jgi:hypothetical protein
MRSRFRQAIPSLGFFGRSIAELNAGELSPVLPLLPPVEGAENLQRSSSIPEILGKLSLDEKQHGVGWWRPTHRFYPAHAGGTQRVEAHTVLRFHQVLLQLRLQKQEWLSGQEAFKQGILRPLAVAQQELVDFGAPLVVRDIIGHHVAGRLPAGSGLASPHISLLLRFLFDQ